MPILNRNKVIDVTPTITAGAYTAADVVGGLITLAVANAGGGGILRNIVVIDDGNIKAELIFHFFTGVPTSISDNAAYAPVVADLKKQIGRVTVATTDYTTYNGNGLGLKTGIGMDFEAPLGNLYAYAVATATPTYLSTSDLTFRFSFWLDAAA